MIYVCKLEKYEVKSLTFSTAIQKKLEANICFDPRDLREIVQQLVSDIHNTASTKVPVSSFRRIVKDLVEKFPQSFTIKDIEG